MAFEASKRVRLGDPVSPGLFCAGIAPHLKLDLMQNFVWRSRK